MIRFQSPCLSLLLITDLERPAAVSSPKPSQACGNSSAGTRRLSSDSRFLPTLFISTLRLFSLVIYLFLLVFLPRTTKGGIAPPFSSAGQSGSAYSIRRYVRWSSTPDQAPRLWLTLQTSNVSLRRRPDSKVTVEPADWKFSLAGRIHRCCAKTSFSLLAQRDPWVA